jgi:hypothetical protein
LMNPLTIVMIYQQDSPGKAAGWQGRASTETRQGLPCRTSTRPFGGRFRGVYNTDDPISIRMM